MRFRTLRVEDFGCIDEAELEFGVGLNVLFGPNDLGKTTLAAAMRAVLLLQPTSSAQKDFRPWHSGRDPRVSLTFEVGDATWRVRKTWSPSSSAQAELARSDGGKFEVEEEGRGVDGKLRELLGWGVAGPGGRGAPRGLPRSFLASTLLGEQAQPYALLGVSLADDTDDSAKARLESALQAMATDPLYQAVLERTQAKVDEAFTETGRPKRGRGSPRGKLAEEVARRRAQAELHREREVESEAVAQRWAELDRARNELLGRRAEAARALSRCEEDLRRAGARADARARVDAARQALAELTRTAEEVEALGRRVERTRSALPGLRAEAEVARERQARSSAEHRALERACALLEAGGDASTQAHVRALEQERQVVIAALARLEEAWAGYAADRAALRACDARLEEAREAVAREDDALQAARDRVAQLRAERDDCRDALAWARARLARSELDAAEAAASKWERHEEARRRAEAEATRLRARWDEDRVPTRSELERLRALAQSLEVAKAALGGGLRMSWTLERAATGAVCVDGGAFASLGGEPIQAESDIRLRIDGVGEIAVQAGDARARQAFEEARQRWTEAFEPWASASQGAGLAALMERCEAAEQDRAEAERLERAAELEARSAEGCRALAEARAARAEEVEVRARALAGVDPATAQRTAAGRDPEAIARDLEDRQLSCAAAEREVGAVERRRAEALTGLALVQQEREGLARRVAEHPEDDGAPLAVQRDQARARRGELEAALEAHGSQTRAELAAQRAASARAQAELADAERAAATLAQRIGQVEAELAADEARWVLRREQLEHLDLEGARAAVTAAEADWAALPEPEGDVDGAAVASVRARCAEIDGELESVLTSLRQQEGALQHVGGEVVRERAAAALEALEAAQRHEAEMELDYEAWHLLLHTLREAESAEGMHLGRALGRHVSERFAALTRGRYEALALGPKLELQGVRTPTGVHEIAHFSEGLKEQVATLLRISVAEHLQAGLVLDDHLAQTDAARAAWFGDLLRTAATSVQVIVLTCRPFDYLDPQEAPDPLFGVRDEGLSLRVVDLTRVLRRACA